MTVQNVGDFETGLEDFDMEDAVIPRLTIVHKEAEFKDSLSNEQFGKLNVIILGLVKQRVLWHQTVDDGDWPMCRSADHNTGFPNLSDEQPKNKRFPWGESNFDPKDYVVEDDEGNKVAKLPCNSCALKEWGSHPDGKRPYCSEQYTLPVLYDPREDDNWVPAILTFQKTGLKPLKSYLTSFARTKTAAFQAITEITLDLNKRGQTDYSVPVFKRIGDTDDSEWHEYSMTYRTIREFLTAEPGTRTEVEDGVGTPSDNAAKPPAQKVESETKVDDKSEDIVEAEVVEDKPEQAEKVTKAEEPKAAEPEAAAEDDDDLPF
jgi:hypothetical protein